jgi:spermidine/putrescine transport system ATP-binding protein
MDSRVHLDNISMKFGDFTAVHPLDLDIQSGEFFSFLGPSGCGKTTLLNIVSGFLEPSSGAVNIGSDSMAAVPANKRPTSMIFQNLALFPLMTVAENIEFGLEVRGVSKAERRKVSDRLLELVDLPRSGQYRIDDLSGGQKQRVAIARALAVEPKVLLLDEPLSALDLKLRQHMRTELKEIQRRTEITFIYITHDQGEALTMSDRVAVMSAGRLQQVDSPIELYRKPRTAFVAEFVGENNRLPGKVVSVDGDQVLVDCGPAGQFQGHRGGALEPGQPCGLYVRPESLKAANAADVNRLDVSVDIVNFEGAHLTLETRHSHFTTPIHVQADQRSYGGQVEQGASLSLGFQANETVVLPEDGAGEATND